MGFFKKALASVGIGSAKVDAILDNTNVQAGGQVSGHIKIKGGKTEQKIDKVYLKVQTKYEKTYESDEGDREHNLTETIQKVEIPVNSVIKPNQDVSIPFKFILDPRTPISYKNIKVWIQTGLDIKKALDPSDRDYINVAPHPYMESVLHSLKLMGFKVREVENEYCKSRKDLSFVQEFEFVPTNQFRGQLDELEIVFFIRHNEGIELAMEIDRKVRGIKSFFSEMVGTDEVNRRLQIDTNTLQGGPNELSNQLYQYINQFL